jgi:Ca2+-binding RTX toxin-like protein
MHLPTPGPRRRVRRALLVAAFAAIALPSVAQAATVSYSRDGSDMFVVGGPEANNVRLTANSTGQVFINDSAGVSGDTNFCSFFTGDQVTCVAPRERISVNTQGGSDVVEYRVPHEGFVDTGDGNDVQVAGTRLANGRAIEPVTYFDLSGNDTISYAAANRGISLTPEDGQPNDGRPGDREQVQPVFETIIGSNFADAPLFGTAGPDLMLGLGGNDQLGGGLGDDRFATGLNDGNDDYHGSSGHDTISYADRAQQVLIDLDNVADDGVAGERDNVRSNIEGITGGRAGDVITGDSAFDVLDGGPGDDRLSGLDGNDLILMGASADGADEIRGGGGIDTIYYGSRTRPINATLNFGGADDGEAGEGDELIGANEQIIGGAAGDTLRAPDGSSAAHGLFGLDGIDTLEGADGPDTLSGGDDPDTLLGEGGDDTMVANDGERDDVKCSNGHDTATIDSIDAQTNCEDREVGVLRLSPKTVKAEAGKPARVRLNWRHPQGWRKLRKVELRLFRGPVPVGTVTIRPRAERVGADGAVKLVRKQTRLTRKGKTVTARLALRLDASLAGQALRTEVEATDTRGARQLERGTGGVRIAG